jgi:predicted enzyme related to lactoylglutathione lyase
MITITAFAFTGYPVTDLGHARIFYEGLLGLKPTTVFERGDEGWIEYELGGATLAISNMADLGKPAAAGPAIICEVADFDAAIATLRAAAVRFVIEPLASEIGQIAVVLDPSGNSLGIRQRRAA